MRICLPAALAVAVIAGAAPAGAKPSFAWYPTVYSACDGYGAPTKYGDGMTELALELGGLLIPSSGGGTTERLDIEPAPEAVRMCEAALASDVVGLHPMRRVSLLQARALHLLAAGDTASALKDLEQAQAVVASSGDPLFKRSLGLNVDYVRAYALGLTGDTTGAQALARASLARRPYSFRSAALAWLTLKDAGEPGDVEAAVRAMARLNPLALNLLFDHLIGQGRMADAAALYPQLVPPSEREVQLSALGELYEDARNHATAGMFWARRGGAYAYALAAAGKPAEARAALAAARARLSRDSGPPPAVRKLMRPAGALKADTYAMELRTQLGVEGGAVLKAWGELVEARALLAEGRVAEAQAMAETLAPKQGDNLGVWDEFQAALRKSLGPAQGDTRLPVRGPGARTPEAATLSGLMNRALEAEVIKHLPVYGDKGVRSKVGDDGVVTVEYVPNVRDAAVSSEEMALLGAADLALASGKSGLIVLDRFDVHHFWEGLPSGYSTELKVRFVDPAALPPGLEDAGWRVLDAAAIRDQLVPAYPRVAEK